METLINEDVEKIYNSDETVKKFYDEHVEDVKTDTDDEATRIVKRYIEISKGERK